MTAQTKPVQRFSSSGGRHIYRLPLEIFPGFEGNAYIVEDGDSVVMVDCGSGLETSRQTLLRGFEEIRDRFGTAVTLEDVDAVLITHGHIDHFGALPWLRQQIAAPFGVHVLDRRVLSHYEERVIVASKHLATFLEHAGLDAAHRAPLMEMYLYAKGRYRSTPVDFLLEETTPAPGGLEVHHVPGHCPGQVCLRVDDILLTADHVLARITPNQAPEAITQHTGLGHYFASLDKISRLPGIRLALGGHEEPIEDFYGRVTKIRKLHDRRLEEVLGICAEPKTTREVSRELFGQRRSYHVLLALLEAGAHIEYLYQRGELYAENLEEIEREANPVIRYRRC